eukprot:CAMPEP_0119300624 /NCGR_PEP_ID=MMETSP1333-20130426/2542_1 /TAXON_ID=418940 /ORGANISM="Scyphosphaera apsteinii, Strain RCC1455" /LENGTH=383 /DNA_ID=CAMNT_0007302461 /DNA_START=46 /DNA_END=1197 /DNA_ORIENTATION=-
MKDKSNPLPSRPEIDVDGGGEKVIWVKTGSHGKHTALLMPKIALIRFTTLISLVLLLVVGTLVGTGDLKMKDALAELQLSIQEERLSQTLSLKEEKVSVLENVQSVLEEAGVNVTVTKSVDGILRKAKQERLEAKVEKASQTLPKLDTGTVHNKVPLSMQMKMLKEFHIKASFLLWAVSRKAAAHWKASELFGKESTDEIVEECDNIENEWGDTYGSDMVVNWLQGNITYGRYPPPLTVVDGLASYVNDLTYSEYAKTWLHKKKELRSHRKNVEFLNLRNEISSLVKEIEANGLHKHGAMDTAPVVQYVFTKVYVTLRKLDCLEWLFPGDDEDIEDGIGKEFHRYAEILFDEDLGDEDEDEDEEETVNTDPQWLADDMVKRDE